MLSEHEWVYERMRLHTLVKAHPDWGARRLAQVLGHDTKWVAKWKSRILSSPKLTLEVFRSQSRAPKHLPRCTSPEARLSANYEENCQSVIIVRQERGPSNMESVNI